MMKKILGILLISMMLLGTAFAEVNVTANVGNENPVVGEILICDGTCAMDKALDPATQFTVSVSVTDPNGQSDVNADAFLLEFYKSADSNGATPSWDNVALLNVAHGTRDGCTETGSVYCLHVETTDWTTKFLAGTATVFVRTDDNSTTQDYNTSPSTITVNASVGHTEDATSGTYTGAPNSSNNAILANTTNAYIETTHNGNVDINVSVTATALDDSVHTPIAVGNQKWYLTNDSGSAVPFTGGADEVKANWGRGTSPTSATQNIYYWLDVPVGQPSGAYTGTLTYSTQAS